jgi:WD repeat-containing protein 19
VALLTNGKCHLHPIEMNGENKQQKPYTMFPDKNDNAQVTHIALTHEFLIYNTDKGGIHQFYLKDWKEINEYRHGKPGKFVFPNTTGTRVCMIDQTNAGYLYNPVNDNVIPIDGFPIGAELVLWDTKDLGIFAVIDMSTLTAFTYIYLAQSVKGPRVKKISETTLPFGFTGILLHEGVVYGQKGSGDIAQIVLESHEALRLKGGRRTDEKLKQCLRIALNLCKFDVAWNLAEEVNTVPAWEAFGNKALEILDIETALLVYQHLRKADKVLALAELQHVDDTNTLAGHICMLNGNYKQAQSLFLDSSHPQLALTMRRDLLDWEQALTLAQNLDKKEVPFICREHAAQLEVMGEYQESLEMFQRAKKEVTAGGFVYDEDVMRNHRRPETGGIARNTLRLSDLLEGVPMAMRSKDKQLMSECAGILFQMKQYGDAAEMYVAAEKFEKAAAIYLQTKKFSKVAPLMAKITTPKLHAKYAKAKEHERDYKAAAESYERAKDIDSVIRLNLQHLDNPEKAFTLVREHSSSEGASMVAQYCQRTGHFQSAIEFLLLAKRSEEAFKMAVDHKQMDKYALALGEEGAPKDYMDIAHYYETQKEWGMAGKFYGVCGEYEKAVQYYLKCGEENVRVSGVGLSVCVCVCPVCECVCRVYI